MSRHRDSTTPMDFEYDNRIGQVDPNSPWVANQPPKKRKLDSFASKTTATGYSHQTGQQLTLRPSFGQPGTHSVLDSPTKSPFATPNRMRLTEPNGQSFLFERNKQLPSLPPHVQKWEPRTPQSVVDFSSGGETPNTPAQDSDAGTPDTQLVSKMGTLTYGGEKKSPKKSKRASLFRMFSSSPSPSKEDPRKEDSRKPFSKKAEHRVVKRRVKQSKSLVLRDDDDDDSDNEQARSRNTNAAKNPPALGFAAKIPGVLAWVEAHPDLPAVLSYYMQLTVNTVLGFGFLWIIYLSAAAVMNDIAREKDVFKRQILHEITICANEYRQNRCDRDMRVPALEQACNQWDLCMQQDAEKSAGARVGARTFAMIFNSFVDEFSWKSMLFTAIMLFGGFNLSNYAFGRFREKQPHPHDFYPPPPATPQRYPSGGYIDQGAWGHHTTYAGTPYGSMNQGLLTQQASQSMPALPGLLEDSFGEGSPSKRERAVFRR